MEPQHVSAQRLYDRRAETYDDSWHRSFAKRIVELANLQPGEDVLDLACGTGLVTFDAAAVVADGGGSVTGVDITAAMLEQALAKREALSASNVRLYRHDVARLDSLDAIRGQTFDAITCASALVLLDDPAGAVKQWAGILKPGGRIVVDALSPSNLIVGMVFERVGRRLGVHIPYNRDWVKSSDSLRDLLQSAGLVLEQIVSMGQTGKGVQSYPVEDADMYFDTQIDTESMKELAKGEMRGMARQTFREEWEKVAIDGVVSEEDLVWVGIARKE